MKGNKKTERSEEIGKEEARWTARLQRSKQFQQKHSSTWDENRRLVFGEPAASTGETTSEQANQVAYGWGLYEGLETAIYVKNPDVIVSARDLSRRPVAQRIQQIVEYDLGMMDAKAIGNLALLDTFTCGYGAVSEVVTTVHQRDEDDQPTGRVLEQEFELRRHEPRDILFDPAARKLDLSDSRYLFLATYPTVEAVQNDPDFTQIPDKIETFPECSAYTRTTAEFGTATPNHPHQNEQGETDPAYRQICVWEVFDKMNHEVLYKTDFKGYIMGRRSWPVNLRFGALDLFPTTLLYMHPVPGRLYPRPEAELIAPQLREINIVERLISEDSKTKFRKWITLSGIFTDEQAGKLTDESLANNILYVDGTQLAEVLGIQGGSIPLEQLDMRKLLGALEDVQAKRDLPMRYEMLEKEIQHIVGYGPSARGGIPSTRSAREAMMINAKQDQRLDKRKDRVNDFYFQIDRKHVRFLQEKLAGGLRRYVKIMPKVAGLAEWASYSRQDISGDFEFEIVAGTSTPKNTEVKKAAVLQMVQAVIPALQQAGKTIEPAIRLLAEVNGWDEVDLCFNGQQEKAKALLQASAGFMAGKVPPEALLDAVGALLMAVLSPAEFEMEKKRLQAGKPQQGGPEGAPAGDPAQGQRGDPNPQATTQGVP